jgi:hypothetical protein
LADDEVKWLAGTCTVIGMLEEGSTEIEDELGAPIRENALRG